MRTKLLLYITLKIADDHQQTPNGTIQIKVIKGNTGDRFTILVGLGLGGVKRKCYSAF